MKQRIRVNSVSDCVIYHPPLPMGQLRVRLSQASLRSSSQSVQGLDTLFYGITNLNPYWAWWLKCSGNCKASVQVKVNVRLLGPLLWLTVHSVCPQEMVSVSCFPFGFITRTSQLTFNNKQTLQCFRIIFFKHGEKLWDRIGLVSVAQACRPQRPPPSE